MNAMNILQHYRVLGSMLLEEWARSRAERRALNCPPLPSMPGPDLYSGNSCALFLRAIGSANGLHYPGATPSESIEHALFSARWASTGWPVLNLTESLAASLVLTDATGVSPDLFRLPFDAFFVEMPWPRTPLSLECRGVRRPVKWILAHRLLAVANEEEGERFERAKSDIPDIDIAFGNGSLTPEQQERVARREHARKALYESLATRAVLSLRLVCPGDGLSVRTVLWWPEGAHHQHTYERGAPPSRPDIDVVTGRDEAMLETAVDMIGNLCLYFSSLPPSVTSVAPRSSESTRRDDDGLPPPERWILGREVKLDARMREAAASYAAREITLKPWKLAARFVVRGHWRNQACGPGHAQHRLRWIEPYWKGTAEAPGLTRSFVLGTPEHLKRRA